MPQRPQPPRRHPIEGHAIVSAEGAIADAHGAKPACLMNPADWRYFQRRLDQSVLVVLGRASHEATPNPHGRRRLVLTRRVPTLKRQGRRTWLWNPAGRAVAEVLAELAPEGGRIAVVGGRGVYELFLALGYGAFHLSVATRCRVPGGVPVFEGVTGAEAAARRLNAAGLTPGARLLLDAAAGVSLQVFRRPGITM